MVGDGAAVYQTKPSKNKALKNEYFKTKK